MKLSDIKAFAWVAGNWQLVLAGAGAVAIYSGAIYFTGREHGYDSCRVKQMRVVEAARTLTEASAAQAAADRETASSIVAGNKENRDEAIQSAPDTAPSTARIALNCERLRAAGVSLDGFPACRGRATSQ